MDVHLIVNRSLVYSLLTAVTVGVYLLSIEGLKRLFASSVQAGPELDPDRGGLRRGPGLRPGPGPDPGPRRPGLLPAGLRLPPDRPRLHRRRGEGLQRRGPPGPLRGHPGQGPARGEGAGPSSRRRALGTPGLALRRGIDYDAVASLLAAPPGPETPLARPELERLGYESALPLPLGGDGRPGWLFVGRKKSGLRSHRRGPGAPRDPGRRARRRAPPRPAPGRGRLRAGLAGEARGRTAG